MADRSLVILVDDDPIIIKIVESMLSKDKVTIVSTTNAVDTLGLIEQNQENVGLVLLDLLLPGIDGYELCRQIRRHSKLPDLPVVAITATASPYIAEETTSAGFNDVILKPFSHANLQKVLNQYRIISE